MKERPAHVLSGGFISLFSLQVIVMSDSSGRTVPASHQRLSSSTSQSLPVKEVPVNLTPDLLPQHPSDNHSPGAADVSPWS